VPGGLSAAEIASFAAQLRQNRRVTIICASVVASWWRERKPAILGENLD
jgi:hypothetical protein